MKRSILILIVLSTQLFLAACGSTATPTALPTATLAPEALQEAIFDAAREDDTEAMRAYIAAGADINAGSEFGATVLSVAVQRGNAEMVNLLLDSGATFEIGVLHYAITQSNGDTEIVKAMVPYTKDINERAKGNPGHTALMYAAENGDVELGRFLLEAGADVDVVDLYNDPAVNVAAFYGELEFVKLLVENGADLNIKGFGRRTALGHAIFRGHTEVADYLRSVGATE
jgi:ankyrin repeat protein